AEAKTRLPKNYAALELDSPTKEGAKARLVKLTDAKGGTIAEAVLGKTRSEGYGAKRKAGTYVRTPGDPQTWLTNVEISAPLATTEWVKTAVLELDADKIDRVSVEIPGEEPLRIARAPAAAEKEKDTKAAGDTSKDAKGTKADDDSNAKDAEAEAGKDAKTPAEAAKPGELAFVD